MVVHIIVLGRRNKDPKIPLKAGILRCFKNYFNKLIFGDVEHSGFLLFNYFLFKYIMGI